MNDGFGELRVIGHVESPIRSPHDAPLQGSEGAPPAWLRLCDWAAPALQGLSAGDDVVVLTWLHLADRETLRVHPRGDVRNPLSGVFATRSPDRPNPIGLHRVTIRRLDGPRVEVDALEAIDGTPILDIKVVLPGEA